MILNRKLFKDLCVVEKEVIDYCMLEETMDKFEDIFAFGEFYAVSRGEAQSLKNLGNIETVILDCWAVYLSMIERNQNLALPNKGLRAFLFSTQHCRPLGMIKNETDVEKVNDLKVEVVDAWEQHVSLIDANSEIKNKNMFFIPMTLEKQEHHVGCL